MDFLNKFLPGTGGGFATKMQIVKNFFQGVKDGFLGVLSIIKRFLYAVVESYGTLNDFERDWHDFVVHDRLSVEQLDGTSVFFVFDQYIGNIRFCLGEIVFKEMWFILNLGCILLIFFAIRKIFDLLKNMIYQISGSSIFGGAFGKFGTFIKKFI